MIDGIDMDGHESAPEAEHEEATARLLRLAGIRADVPRDREDRVREAVLDECRTVARARVVRRRIVTLAAVLSAAAGAAAAVRLLLPREITPAVGGASVATVERLEGIGGRLSGRSGSTPSISIRLADVARVGDQIETYATGRVGLGFSAGVSVRFDHGSQARLLSATRIELGKGALYVDSGPASPDLEVHTPFGVVRDVGTQFEIRLDASSLRVRVRSGVVEVHRGAEVLSARLGTELTLGTGAATSRAVAPHGPEWAWTASLGPDFAIEGRPLVAFLEHLCREQGWTLSYADALLAREASDIILHGSTEGLPPSDALAIVLATTGLAHRFRDGDLLVTRIAQP